MKRFCAAVLAAFLTFSAASLPLYAEETPAEVPLVKDNTGSAVTVDGERKPEEGWAETPYLLLDSMWDGTPAGETLGDVYVSYDSDYLYLFVNNTHSHSPIRVMLDVDGSGNKTVGNWLNFCFYNWNNTGGRSAGAVEGSSLQLDIFCDFYKMYSETDHALWQKTAWHGFGDNGLAAMEMKIPMTEELKAGIANQTVKLGVSVKDKFTSNEGYSWSAAKVPLNFEVQTAETEPTVKMLPKAGIVVDGEMGEQEDWRALPYLSMRTFTDGTRADAPTEMRISSDGDTLFFFLTCQKSGTDRLTLQVALNAEEPQSRAKDAYAEFDVDLTASGAAALREIRWGDGVYAAGDPVFDGSKVCLKETETARCVEISVPLPLAVRKQLLEQDLNASVGVFERKTGSNAGLAPAEGFDPNRATVAMKLVQNTDLGAWIAISRTERNLTNLEGLRVNVIGDSYLAGQTLPQEQVWCGLLASKYNWSLSDFASNGNMVSAFGKLDGQPMCKRYKMMTANSADLVIVNGGRNDYNNGVPLGTVDGEDADTFMGALNVLFAGLRKKYPNAMLVYTTVWNFPDTNAESRLTYLDYANAAKAVCEKQGVYCFAAYDPAVSGVDMRDEAFRTAYCLTADDVSHLNLSGMKKVMPAYESFLAESLTDWKNKSAEPSESESQTETEAPGSGEGTTAAPNAGQTAGGCASAVTALPAAGLLFLCGGILLCRKYRVKNKKEGETES